MSREEFLRFLNELLTTGWYAPPFRYYMKKNAFDKMSYKRWTVFELRDFAMRQPYEMRPVDIVEKFRKMADNFACSNKAEDIKFIFSVAYDTATDILDMLL